MLSNKTRACHGILTIFQTALSETGFEDRLDRMSRSLQHHNHKLENVTSVMRGVMEDVRSLSITTSNYFTLINEHAAIIRKQNETINALNIKVRRQQRKHKLRKGKERFRVKFYLNGDYDKLSGIFN